MYEIILKAKASILIANYELDPRLTAKTCEIGVASTPRISTNPKVPITKISLFITQMVQYY